MTGPSPGQAQQAPDAGDALPVEPPTDERPGTEGDRPRSRAREFARELPVILAIAVAATLLVKTFAVEAFFVPSASMEPTLMPGDRILVNRVVYRIGDIHRQDVVVFTDPQSDQRGIVAGFVHWLVEGIGVARPADQDFVKRVIGLPGDTVEITNGVVFVNGAPLDEPYKNGEPDTRPFGPVTVPPGMLFVLGDNRAHSGDSRFEPPNGVGEVPVDDVVGKAFLVVWPPSRTGLIG